MESLEQVVLDFIQTGLDSGALGLLKLASCGLGGIAIALLSVFGFRGWVARVARRHPEWRGGKSEDSAAEDSGAGGEAAFRGTDILVIFGLWVLGEFLAVGAASVYDMSFTAPAEDGTREGLSSSALVLYQSLSFVLRIALALFVGVFVWLRIMSKASLADALSGPEPSAPSRSLRFGFVHLGLGRGLRSRVGAGFVAFAVMLPAWIVFAEVWAVSLLYFRGESEPQSVVQSFFEAVAQGEWVGPLFIVLSAVVAAPIFEEILFRGLLARWLSEQIGPVEGVVLSAIAFMVVHSNLQASLPLFCLALFLGYYHLKTRDLWGCIALHAVFNASQLVLLTVLAR